MSERDRYQRIRELFHAVCDLAPADCAAYLDEHCADTPDVRAEVLSLLGIEGAPRSKLLDQPIGEVGKLNELSEDAAASLESTPLLTQIGQYRTIGTLGSGGMGVVYKAEQKSPARTVALKVIRAGMATGDAARRFRHEAEVLGRLQHPGIAQVYEAGIAPTPLGPQPYFAMELIAGCTLVEFARRGGLDLRGKLSLFARVCDAVQHAHERGVIHRDLKPANILVDATGQPKILDFGIARVTDAEQQLATMQTAAGQIVGTLPYMSPEQVSGGAVDVDTRSDVYSLGVTLYELLAGRLPCDVSNCSLAQAARVIVEFDPPRLGTLDRAFRGDVETLVAKVLEKEKLLRYASAGELAADIRRYLDNLPLVARPNSAVYQLRKFASRNRMLVGAAALCVLLLVGGVAGTTAGLISARRANRQLEEAAAEARRQRDRAQESEARATTELARSRQVTRLMRSMLQSVNPSVARERDTTLLREILESAVKRLDVGEIADQPAVEAEMRATICDTYNGIGDNAAALRVIEPAIRLARAAKPEDASQFQRARISYATQLVVWGRLAEAKDEFEQALAIQERGLPEDETAGVLYSNYAGVKARLGDTEGTLELNLRALEIRKMIFGPRHFNVAASMANIAGSLQDMQRHDESLAMLKDALSIYRDANPPRLLHITIIETNMAGLLLDMKRPAEAAAAARDALDIGAKIYQPNHQQMGMARFTLGLALQSQGRHDEAREHFARAAEILTSAFNESHGLVANARMELGRELVELGRFAEAEEELLAAQRVFNAAAGDAQAAPGDPRHDCREALVQLYERWHTADPAGGHATQRDSWLAKLRAASTSAPVTRLDIERGADPS